MFILFLKVRIFQGRINTTGHTGQSMQDRTYRKVLTVMTNRIEQTWYKYRLE